MDEAKKAMAGMKECGGARCKLAREGCRHDADAPETAPLKTKKPGRGVSGLLFLPPMHPMGWGEDAGGKLNLSLKVPGLVK